MQFVFPAEPNVADFFVDVVKMQDIFFLKWGMVFELCAIFFNVVFLCKIFFPWLKNCSNFFSVFT